MTTTEKGGEPRLAGVIGWPIGHSRSPKLHGHWLRRYGIQGSYIPIALEPERLAEGIEALRTLSFRGFNATIPHKEALLALATEISPRARRIGAANTALFLADGGLAVDNTDGYGFLANLRQSAPDWEPTVGPALVLGAGGAARAVVDALLEAGVPDIRLANRTRDRAEELRAHFGARVGVVDWHRTRDAADGAMTIVNTTSLGMAGQPDLDVDLVAAPAGALVTDIVYTPLRTPLLRAAEARGLRTVDGLGMLLHQAAPGFEQWFGVRPEVDDDLRMAVLG